MTKASRMCTRLVVIWLDGLYDGVVSHKVGQGRAVVCYVVTLGQLGQTLGCPEMCHLM